MRRRGGRRAWRGAPRVLTAAEVAALPLTRRRVAAIAAAADAAAADAAAAAAADAEEGHAPINISSESDAGESEESGSEEDGEEEEEEEEDSEEDDGEEPSGDEDYIDISDSGESCVDISDSGEIYVDISDDDEEEGSSAANEGEAEADPPCADRSEAACIKIADLLRRGRNLDGVRLAECKAYLKNIGLPQVGDVATCIERIMLHQRFKDEDPEKIYPRSSFCINCKGDVCRGDTVLFKQKIHEKSVKRNSKCMLKRIVAGKVVKESYGKERMQHTFTIQVFWSIGGVKLPPLHLLLVKGRNLYKMITFRQPWSNEADRLKALEEKHSRGDAARCARAAKRRHVAPKAKRLLEKGKHRSQPGGPDDGSNITKGRKRVTQSSNPDRPTKKIRKEERRVSSGKKRIGGRRKAKSNSAPLDKNICTSSSSSLLNVNTETDHATQKNNMQTAPVNNGLLSKKARARKRKAALKAQSTVGGNHDQFEATHASSTSHPLACPGKSVGMHHPVSERTQRPPPLREIGNEWQPHMKGRLVSRPNPAIVLGHPNVAPASWLAPGCFGVPPPNQPGVVFPPFNMSQTVYQRHQEGAYVMPQTVYQRHPEGAYVMP